MPELFFETGRFFGQKVGRADESEVFREYFLKDPDEERWQGGPDEEINPDGKDNYLVASDWYQKANDTLEIDGVEQHKMDRALFIAYPYRSLMDFAVARQRDGLKDVDLDELVKGKSAEEAEKAVAQAYESWSQVTRTQWEDAYMKWTTIYGRTPIEVAGFGGQLILEPDDDVLQEFADAEGTTLEDKKHWQQRYQKTTNYTYWKKRCDIEKRDLMSKAPLSNCRRPSAAPGCSKLRTCRQISL